MRMIAYIIVLIGMFSATNAFAQQDPFRGCVKNTTPSISSVTCTVLENDLFISDAIFNRGNCPSTKKHVEMISGPGSIGAALGNTIATTAPFEGIKLYKFGDLAILKTNGCPNIIEVTLVTNKGNWTFTW